MFKAQEGKSMVKNRKQISVLKENLKLRNAKKWGQKVWECNGRGETQH